MRRYQLYIFDLDGTLYRGSEALPGATETVSELRRSGSIVRFLTNNSSQTPEHQASKLTAMGIDAIPSEVLTSGMGAAHYLAEQKCKRLFVVGEPGLVEVLSRKGLETCAYDAKPDAVLAGICRTFTYEVLSNAMHAILSGARFVATNRDATYPMEHGKLIPGAGAIVSSIETCSETEPFVVGKPNPFLLQMILSETGLPAIDTLVVGDRFETDIVSGINAGCDTLLVLTGVTKTAPAGHASAQTLLQLIAG